MRLLFSPLLQRICRSREHRQPMFVIKSHLPFLFFSSQGSLKPNSATKDLVLQSVKDARHICGLLNIVGTHYESISNIHVMRILKTLFEFQKSECSRMETSDIMKNEDFKKLCKRLKYQSRSMPLSDVIESLKILSYIGVPASSTIFQVLLQLVRHNVNDLNLSQIMFLDFILKKCGSTQLGDALSMALPIVFDIHLKMKFDSTSNLNHVVDLLQYATSKNSPCSSVHFLLDHIANTNEKLDVCILKKLIWCVMEMEPSPSVQNFLPQVMENMSSNIDNISPRDIVFILSKCAKKYSLKHSYYYNEKFFDSCARFIVKHDCGLNYGVGVLKNISSCYHVNIELLDYLCEEVEKEPEKFINSKTFVLFSLLGGLSAANYKPANWNNIESLFLRHKTVLNEDIVGLPWYRFATELASLQCFPQNLIERIFSEDFIEKFLSRDDNFLDQIQILKLYQVVRTLMPHYSGPFPPEKIVKNTVFYDGYNEDFPLKGALEQGLGGPSYLLTNTYTKLGHFIDHAFAIRKGGFPVAINLNPTDSRMFIEDIEVPADCKIILVLCFSSTCYAVNCNRLRGAFSVLQQSLEAMGYGVIVFSLKAWSEMPDHEKIPYIMQSIRLKFERDFCIDRVNLNS